MIKLSKPYISNEAIKKLEEVIVSGNLVQGIYVERFERALEEYLDVKNVVVVASGTAALHLALLSLDISDGDEVIVPSFTFPATANVVEVVGAKPVFVDIDINDCCIDVTKIETSITNRTRAIMPVHEFGQAARMDDIINIAKKHNLAIIEDAACALGTEYKNKKVGTFGALGCFSFHPRKAITTGEGGAIAINDDILASKIRSLRNHGIEKIKDFVDFVLPGLNYRMTDFQAALGCEQIKNIDANISYRIELANQYSRRLDSFKWLKTPLLHSNSRMVYQTYHVILDEHVDRDEMIKFLKQQGIETNYGAQALNCLSFFKNKYGLNADSFSNSTRAFFSGLALPMGQHVDSNGVDEICSKMEAFYEIRKK